MSDGVNLILPGDGRMAEPPEDGKLTKEQLAQAEAQLRRTKIEAEAAKYEELIECTINTEVEPYKANAPLCDNFVGTTAVAKMTEHLGQDQAGNSGVPGPIQIPRWTHGQCIGAECNRFVTTKRGPICGKVLQDLRAGKELGVIAAADIKRTFEAWAIPDDAPEKPVSN